MAEYLGTIVVNFIWGVSPFGEFDVLECRSEKIRIFCVGIIFAALFRFIPLPRRRPVPLPRWILSGRASSARRQRSGARSPSKSNRRSGLRQSRRRSLAGGKILSKPQKPIKLALALNGSLPGISLNLGLTEFKQGHFEAAISPLKAACRQDPSSAQARTLLGMHHYGTRCFGDAIRYLEPLVRTDPETSASAGAGSELSAGEELFLRPETIQENPRAEPELCGCTHVMGEALDGLAARSRGHRRVSGGGQGFSGGTGCGFGLGYLYWKTRQYDDAKREFEAELKIDANHAQALAYLGDIELKRENLGGRDCVAEESPGSEERPARGGV